MGSTYWDIGGHSLEVAEWRLRSTLGEESTPPFGFPLERPKTVSGSARFCVSVEGHRISSPPCTPAGGAISGRCIFSKDSPAPFCFAKLAKCRRPICCSGRNGRLVGDGFRAKATCQLQKTGGSQRGQNSHQIITITHSPNNLGCRIELMSLNAIFWDPQQIATLWMSGGRGEDCNQGYAP